MNTKIIIGAVSVIVVAGGILLITTGGPNGQNNSACAEMCQRANQACPSLINEGDCNNKCAKLSEESKKHLSESSSCQEITSKPELIADLLVPEANTPETANNSANSCETACGNYVGKCLALVPNANQSLFLEGAASCMKECAKWKSNKVDCMITTPDCESMTNVCGL